MLDRRLEDFDEQARFVSALLGLLSTSERVVRLLGVRSQETSPAADSPLLDAALGLVSLRQSLLLALADPAPAKQPKAPNDAHQPSNGAEPAREHDSWLR